MRCSVFIATSLDGYIARNDGDIEWLHTVGDQTADMQGNQDMGFAAFMEKVDCMIMGRHTMAKIASFNLTKAQWPYGDIPVFVLSRKLNKLHEHLPDSVSLFNGDIHALMSRCKALGLQHAYVDGGATISAFINLGLIQEMIVTRAPVILLKGRPLFRDIERQVIFERVSSVAFNNNFIQERYSLSYRS